MPSTIFGTCSPPRRPYTRAPHSQPRSTSQPWPQSTECKKKAVGTMAHRRRPNYTGGRWRWRRRGIMRAQLTVKIRLHDLSPRHFQNISTISTHFHATIISRTALSPAHCPCSLAPGAPLISHHRQRHHHRENRSIKETTRWASRETYPHASHPPCKLASDPKATQHRLKNQLSP